jgi:hypothetical protein
VIVLGLLFMIGSAGTGAYLAWQIRDVMVRIHVGEATWTGHLYGLLILGALLACWFLLGAAFIQCRIAERRHARSEGSQPAERSQPAAPARVGAARAPSRAGAGAYR